jgi:hypothetical protein
MQTNTSERENPAPYQPAPAVRNKPVTEGARHGGAGMCAACGDWIINHFDANKPREFIGCTNEDVTDGTVFTMVPVAMAIPPGRQHDPDIDGSGTRQQGTKRRKFQVAMHFLRLPEGKTVEDITKPGTAKEKVVKYLQNTPKGVLARDIIDGTGLTHGDVQQALRWLRDHDIVESVEADLR